MVASKREASVHVRMSEEADAVLELMCQAHGIDKAKLCADLLEESLLGRGHALKLAAMRYARLGLRGSAREHE